MGCVNGGTADTSLVIFYSVAYLISDNHNSLFYGRGMYNVSV
jgi:hypothetical protein